MIDRKALLDDLQRLLKKLEVDLRTRAEEVAAIDADLKAQHATAVAEKRTAATFKEWREDLITQAKFMAGAVVAISPFLYLAY